MRTSTNKRSPAALFCVYTGSSMAPLLVEHDLLEIIPYDERTIRLGDVILFLSPEGGQLIAHRIVDVTSKGIRTRGDSNSKPDSYLRKPINITGQVVASWRGQKRRKILGGLIGLVLAYLTRYLQLLDRGIAYLLRPIYHFVACSGIVRRVLPIRLNPRVVIFQTHDGNHMRLLLGSRTVGHYNSYRQQWSIRRPFRLFVDEQTLPGKHAIHYQKCD